MVKLAKAAKKQANPKKKAPPPPKEVEEESSEDESEEEEEAPPPKATKKATPAKPAPAKAAKNGKAAKKAESEDDEDDSDEESEEEAPPPKKTTPAKPKAAPAKAEESDEDDDDDDDDEESEEEAPPPKKATPAKPSVKVTPAKEESDEEDEDEDDSEEEMDTAPAPVAAAKAKKAGMVKAKEESSEEDDEEDDDEEEEDDEEEDESPAPAKRKAESKKETPPAKKAKADGEGFSLFIGNLNSNKDFDELKEAISNFFSKNSLEVMDVRLGATKKFGYVDFSTEEDLLKAIELNGKKLMGQEIKLDRARSKESSQEGKKERDARTLFVKNLPFSATADELREVFADAVEIRVPPGQNGTNRGIAYIEFKTEAIAEKMLEESQGADVQGRSIMVDFTGDKSQKGGRAPAAAAGGGASKTLVVNNLSYSATEDSLQSTFEKAVSIRVPQKDGRAKGFAFIEFESAEEAKDALENLNNTEIEGRTIRLEFSQNSRDGGRDAGRGNGGPTKTLFVKGLSEDTTDQTLRDSFEGAVAARIVTDRDTGSSKGFGFVDFDNEQDCKAAKEAMDDGDIDGSKVTLDYARPKGEGGFRGGRGGGGFGGRGGGGRGGRGGFGRGGGGGGGFRGGRGGRGGGRGFGGGFGGGRGGGGGFKPQGKKIKFDD
ncbi:nucleolin [Aplochiton taeniatus]